MRENTEDSKTCEKEVMKRMSFEDIQDKLARIRTEYIFQIQGPLKDLVNVDLPVFCEDKQGGISQYEHLRSILDMHLSDLDKVIKFISMNIEHFGKGVK